MKELNLWGAVQIFMPFLITLVATWAYFHTQGLIGGENSVYATFEVTQNLR